MLNFSGRLILISLLILSPAVADAYFYNFNAAGVLPEAGQMAESWSPYWWVNSGAYLKLKDGHGGTNQGALALTDPWRARYAASSGTDTAAGRYPQNLFRLLTKNRWQDERAEVYFVIKQDNQTASPNRNGSNGLLLMNRYQDGDNLYYAGVRVDGSAIIKKKQGGRYYTLAEVKNIYPGKYDEQSKTSLLPKNKWIGLRSEVENLPGGRVAIKLYLDRGWQGKWQLIASATDDGQSGGSALTDAGYAGLRTDFMDVEFENFRLKNL